MNLWVKGGIKVALRYNSVHLSGDGLILQFYCSVSSSYQSKCKVDSIVLMTYGNPKACTAVGCSLLDESKYFMGSRCFTERRHLKLAASLLPSSRMHRVHGETSPHSSWHVAEWFSLWIILFYELITVDLLLQEEAHSSATDWGSLQFIEAECLLEMDQIS